MKALNKTLMNALMVTQITGTPQALFKDLEKAKAPIKLTQNFKLNSDVQFTLKDHDLLDFKINDQYRVLVLPKTKIDFSGTQEKEGFQVRSVTLDEGSVYFENSISKKEFETPPVHLKSDFFDLSFAENAQVKVIFQIDSAKTELFICNGHTEKLKVNLFDHEISPDLEMNQGIRFKGIAKEGKLSYDLLLENRKIPQGQWAEKEKCSLEVVEKIQKEADSQLKKIKLAGEAKKKKKALAQQKKDSEYLCHKPYGKLNQCYFETKAGECHKSRCNAEGKWVLETKLSPSGCQSSPSENAVKDCN